MREKSVIHTVEEVALLEVRSARPRPRRTRNLGRSDKRISQSRVSGWMQSFPLIVRIFSTVDVEWRTVQPHEHQPFGPGFDHGIANHIEFVGSTADRIGAATVQQFLRSGEEIPVLQNAEVFPGCHLY